ncbi:hypothetical protein ASA1KI_41950 [Opitutales bacterium ASA1]|uniref:ISKra4 family transposase n=1 Tax=Congregicoccus parvus TaxID=3081749 RepID=UPI002B2B8475|nr:hypothetical protein ASA1KI_07330 [Opitutales bacterium ASA1]BET67231.1 hypothetical protein ASA1KI_21490 [Opitutales bacterium ASA1]BET67243.1 hypothetical protein ASA1KI_21610 [Opitutales bacterium ASA1]BET69277.1 hypothetical protein ASA1KI_41950 [Opitutales bacterium ASA1]
MGTEVKVEKNGRRVKVSIEVEFAEDAGMLECETAIQDALNQAGCELTVGCLERYDTDGSPIEVEGVKLTSKGLTPCSYQTPYGEATMRRHVYQSGWGGTTYCPLERSARVIEGTTPRFAQMCALKYATLNSVLAQKDLAQSHRRSVSRCYLQDISAAVASIAQRKQQDWTYADGVERERVAFICVSIDGTCMLYCQEGWRTAMVGTVSLYDAAGERLQSVYFGSPPQYGKDEFFAQMQRLIAVYKQRYAHVRWIGVADGAKENWSWLADHVQVQVLDFWHAASYLQAASEAMGRSPQQRQEWFEQARHQLKFEPAGARTLLARMRRALADPAVKGDRRADLERAIGYFANNLSRMNYTDCRFHHWPLGSGVIEAACKTLVKQRMCGAGMKWKHDGAATVLSLRSIVLSGGDRWSQFWAKIERFGV